MFDSNFCRACEQEKDTNKKGYCMDCFDEISYYLSKPAWHNSTVTFSDGSIIHKGETIKVRGVVISLVDYPRPNNIVATYCNQVSGEIDSDKIIEPRFIGLCMDWSIDNG
jgi:hypothetical protein